MAGRAATAVKTKTTSKPRATTKTSSRAKVNKSSGATATVEAPAKPRRRTKKAESRTRLYWAVFNSDLKRVAVFEFDQKVEAEKRASKLTDSSGDKHFIQKIKATVHA